MNISDKHVKKFNRLLKKYGVSLDFVMFNFGKILKLYNYVSENHHVIKKTLIIKKNKVVIKYYTLRTKLFSLPQNNMKKRRREFSWSKRVVKYMKKRSILDHQIDNEIEDVEEEPKESSDDIQKKIKEQLERLKSGKKTFSMLDKSNKMFPLKEILENNTSECSTTTATSSREISLTVDLNKTNTNDESEIPSFSNSTWDDCSIIDLANISDLQISKNVDKIPTATIYTELNSDISNNNKNETDDSKVVSKNRLKFLDLLINKMQKASNDDNTTLFNREEKDNSQGESGDIILKNVKIFEVDASLGESQNCIDETDCIPTTFEKTDSTGEKPKQMQQIQILTNIEEIINNENLRSTEIINSQTNLALVRNDSVKQPKTAGTQVNSEETSSSSSEFLGFTEYELTPCTVPGMLPTPLVTKSTHDTNQSAFISEDLDNFLRENPRDNVVSIEVPKQKNFEDGLVCDGSQPPRMIMPIVPAELTKPRTVAQKRHVLQRKQSIKYYMIENENTIYRELKKRTKFGKANASLIRYIQKIDLPFTRDCWKASSWLSTENGRFYYQILNVNGTEVKLIGGKGNHPEKYMPKQISNAFESPISKQCPPGCRQNVDFRNIQINLPSDDENELEDIKIITPPDLKLQIGPVKDEKPFYKPAPLSRKCLYSPFEPNMGVLEVYEMPDIQLEVSPAVDKPLEDVVKPYLKLILPSECITREWAEFAVSTLLTKDGENPELKSFTFTIPYLNNQKTVLVRKVYNRKENLERFSTDDFIFRKTINTEDEVTVECADILSEMINSVAIGMSEDSFIKDDPDIDYSNNKKVNAETQQDSGDGKILEKKTLIKKRSTRDKLMLELKKLNATVIDAEYLYPKDDKDCNNAFCKFGCVCQSMSGQPIMRKHCKKSSCMVECSCKRTITSDLKEFVSSSLTTEDALLIRKKATAKLARVEKDFCATVVLTDNKTFLINDPENDRKRSKRAPKRFDDYDTIDKKDNFNDSDTTIPILYPYDDEPPPKRFKHCNVDITRLMWLDNLEPWCMVHCLYKCFCRLENVTGVPFEIKKEETLQKEEEVCYPRKRLYSFEKATNSPNKSMPQIDNNEKRNKIVSKKSLIATEEPLDNRKNATVIYEREINEKCKYMYSGNNLCKRICPIPAQVYREINKRRSSKVRKSISAAENDKTKLILADKVYQSFSFDIKKYAEENSTRSLLKSGGTSKVQPLKKFKARNVEELEITAKPTFEEVNVSKIPIISSVRSLNIGSNLGKELELLNATTRQSNTLTANTIESNLNQVWIESSPTFNSNNNSSFATPVMANSSIPLRGTFTIPSTISTSIPSATITSSFPSTSTSVTSTNNLIPSTNNLIPSTSTSISNSNFFKQIPKNSNINDKIHSLTISNLNAAVTKTMHSICSIQKRNTKYVPPPVKNTLNSHQWKLFLQAHLEELVYIWEIRISDGSFIAATIKNIMPIIPNALSVINIKAIPDKNLPLLGKMLKAKIDNNSTNTLSVLMSGQQNYWRIIGFINSSYDYLSRGGIFKPTPQSHPWLSKKINKLFNSLMLREFKSNKQHVQNLISNFPIHNVNHNIPDNLKVADNVNAKNFAAPVLPVPSSNLQIKTVTHKEILGTVIPIAVTGDHRWLILELVDDFSHIYIPAWKTFLTHDRIKKAIMLTRTTSKIVRIGQETNTFDVFATPDVRARIYIGPYDINKEHDIVLYQNVDSRMLLREEFEKSQNIIRQEKTIGFWLFKKHGKVIFDMDIKTLQMSDAGRPVDIRAPEDDCIIVEDEENAELLKSKEKNDNSAFSQTFSLDNYSINNSFDDNSSFGTKTNSSHTITNFSTPADNFMPQATTPQNIKKIFRTNDILKPNDRFIKHTKYAAKKVSLFSNKNSILKNSYANEIPSKHNLSIPKSGSSSTNLLIGNVSTMKVAKISPTPTSSNIFIIKNPIDTDRNKECNKSSFQQPQPFATSRSTNSKELTTIKKVGSEIDNISEILKECEISVSAIPSEQPNEPKKFIINKTSLNQSLQAIGTSHQTVTEDSESIASINSSNILSQKLLSSITMSGPHPSNTTISKPLVTSSTNDVQNSDIAMRKVFIKKVATENPTKKIATTQLTNSTNFMTVKKASTTITPLLKSQERTLKQNTINMNKILSETKNLPGSKPIKKMYLTTISSSGQPTTSTISLTTSATSSTIKPSLKYVLSGNKLQTSESKVVNSQTYKVKDSLPLDKIQANDAKMAASTSNRLTNFFSAKQMQIKDSKVTASNSSKVNESSNNLSSDNQLQKPKAAMTALKSNVLPSGNQIQTNEAKETISDRRLSDILSDVELKLKESEVVATTSNSGDTLASKKDNDDKMQVIYEPEYGYMISNKPNFGKYPVKRLGDVYLLKMPNLKGILRIMGINLVNKYLAQYIKKNAEMLPSVTPDLRWNFVPHKSIKRKDSPENKQNDETRQSSDSSDEKKKGSVVNVITVQKLPPYKVVENPILQDGVNEKAISNSKLSQQKSTAMKRKSNEQDAKLTKPAKLIKATKKSCSFTTCTSTSSSLNASQDTTTNTEKATISRKQLLKNDANTKESKSSSSSQSLQSQPKYTETKPMSEVILIDDDD